MSPNPTPPIAPEVPKSEDDLRQGNSPSATLFGKGPQNDGHRLANIQEKETNGGPIGNASLANKVKAPFFHNSLCKQPSDVLSEYWNYPSGTCFGETALGGKKETRFSQEEESAEEKPVPEMEPEGNGHQDEDDEGEELDARAQCREMIKVAIAITLMIVCWACIFLWLVYDKSKFSEPDCSAYDSSDIRSCEKCGGGTNVLPLLGEYERTWSKEFRAILYLIGMLWIFMGMGIVCDQFMAGIEAITDSEKIIRRNVNGHRRKFRVKVWNATLANLTLMALGSSAPEILLTATELMGNDFFSGRLGPQTIVGSAAFNLFVISAVCVSAVPAPDTKKIEGMDAFRVTATMSLWAYIWMLLMLQVISPQRVSIEEGVATLAFFFILLTFALLADKGYCRLFSAEDKGFDLEKEQEKAVQDYGKTLPVETLKRLKYPDMRDRSSGRWSSRGSEQFGRTSGSFNEQRGSGKGMGKGKGIKRASTGQVEGKRWASTGTAYRKRGGATVGFEQSRYYVLECVGVITLRITMSAPQTKPVTVSYFSREGTARVNERYKEVEGVLTFGPGETEKTLSIQIVDDQIWNPEEYFYVELDELQDTPDIDEDNITGQSSMKPGGDVSFSTSTRVALVTILNDDIAGTLSFGSDEVFVQQNTVASLDVCRTDGWCGKVKCEYETVDAEAIGGQDYTSVKGTLWFDVGVKKRNVEVPILPSTMRREGRFKVRLIDPSPGLLFDAHTDGGESSAICDVVIEACGETSCWLRCTRFFFNAARWEVAKEMWRDQRTELLYCNGSAKEQAESGIISWLAHFMALNWKVKFLITPPPLLAGGWPCFWVALFLIGGVTMLAGDLASLLGCCLGIPDDVTAITLVALGTSLPDTMASRHAALNNDYADAAIGNVTGSNSVNVFLGAGISWTIGAVYWKVKGPTHAWLTHKHKDSNYEKEFKGKYPDGGFIVPIPSLAFSVAVYSTLASVCLSLLYFRRLRYGGELGGPAFAQHRDMIILCMLWVVFIVSVSVYSSSI